MSYDLEILVKHRNDLLLAEVAAWLHDWRKCSDEHLKLMSGLGGQGLSKKELEGRAPEIKSSQIYLAPVGCNASVFEVMEKGRRGQEDETGMAKCILYLRRCHHAAHIEKEKEEKDEEGRQDYNQGVLLSSAFGVENTNVRDLTGRLWGLQWSSFTDTSQHAGTSCSLSQVFGQALGDTRRPVNEVTLWDWSATVAALYKAALAGALLGYQPDPKDLRWRLLSVRVDSAAFLDSAVRIPDLLARRTLLSDAFERVRKLLEETYPLSTCVYQDEDGSVYVVPNLANLLDLANSQRQRLEELIRAEFSRGTINGNTETALLGEVAPVVKLHSKEWRGQRPDPKKTDPTLDELPPVVEILNRPVYSYAVAESVAECWQNAAKKDTDICPVCALRPQGFEGAGKPLNKKALERKVCGICERRREDRAREWATQDLNNTVWLDEVADINGRAALIVGQFDLDKWLDGTYVKTLAVTEPQNGKADLKNPSFARLHRVWETTRAFWRSVLDEANLPRISGRLVIQSSDTSDLGLGPYHAYDLLLGPTRLGVLHRNGDLITVANLCYTAKQLGAKSDQCTDPFQARDFVKRWLEQRGSFDLEAPSAYGRPGQVRGRLHVERIHIESTSYTPAIPILSEPRTFMALVPAKDAFGVIKTIKEKYEREMSKVRNRLPLALGVVYFRRQAPLAAVMDTGRRMLRRRKSILSCKVLANQLHDKPDAPSPLQSSLHFKQWREIKLRFEDREFVVPVSTVMGDGTTQDVWYPYWRVVGKPADRQRWFIRPDGGEHWVHVSELRKDDVVEFALSTFDFEFLDTTARRFEVNYNDTGWRRGGDKRQRPYLLEEINDFEIVWQHISNLSNSQIKALESTIETRRSDWGEPRGTQQVSPTFRQFVRDVLHEAGVYSDLLERAGVSGMLTDVLELYVTIAKIKS